MRFDISLCSANECTLARTHQTPVPVKLACRQLALSAQHVKRESDTANHCCVLSSCCTGEMQGSTFGYVRFETPEQAQIAWDNTDDGKIVICDCAAFVKILKGEEEREHFEKVGQTCAAKQPAAVACIVVVYDRPVLRDPSACCLLRRMPSLSDSNELTFNIQPY